MDCPWEDQLTCELQTWSPQTPAVLRTIQVPRQSKMPCKNIDTRRPYSNGSRLHAESSIVNCSARVSRLSWVRARKAQVRCMQAKLSGALAEHARGLRSVPLPSTALYPQVLGGLTISITETSRQCVCLKLGIMFQWTKPQQWMPGTCLVHARSLQLLGQKLPFTHLRDPL